MMTLTAWRLTRPKLWFALYSLAALCVLSFIAFEVLDLDGSDFAADSKHSTLKPGEAEREDIRRIGLASATLVVSPFPDLPQQVLPTPGLIRPRLRLGPPAPSLVVRIVLPRAALADVPPAA